MLGFGRAVLAIEESIVAFAADYRAAESYPEDIPCFTEFEEWPQDELRLGASHVSGTGRV